MDGRRLLAAVLLSSLPACAGTGTPVDAVAEHQQRKSEDAAVEETIRNQPELEEIFRPGRFTFRGGEGLESRYKRLIEEHPLGDDGMDELEVNFAVDRRRRLDPMIVVVGVWGRRALEDPGNWEGFIRGVEGAADDLELETGSFEGVEFAYGEAKGQQMLALDYEGVLLLVIARPTTPRSHLEELARFLMGADA